MTTAAVIIAAGSGRRLGRVAKATLRTGTTTYLGRIVETARAAGVEHVVVVVGPPHDEVVRAEAHRLLIDPRDVVDNPDPDRGMSSSIELGFRAVIRRWATRAFLWPVDHPFVTTKTLAALAKGLGTHDAARPVFGGRGGHPPLVAKLLFLPLAACGTDPEGARGVLAKRDVVAIEVEDPGVVHDIDTPEDLA